MASAGERALEILDRQVRGGGKETLAGLIQSHSELVHALPRVVGVTLLLACLIALPLACAPAMPVRGGPLPPFALRSTPNKYATGRLFLGWGRGLGKAPY